LTVCGGRWSRSGNTGERLRWARHFREFEAMTTLDRRAVVALIQSIKVISKEMLEITYRYQAEYARRLAKLEAAKEAV